jgi:hypothetical protein
LYIWKITIVVVAMIASFQLLLHSAIVLYTTTPHSPVKRARHKTQAKELYAA